MLTISSNDDLIRFCRKKIEGYEKLLAHFEEAVAKDRDEGTVSAGPHWLRFYSKSLSNFAFVASAAAELLRNTEEYGSRPSWLADLKHHATDTVSRIGEGVTGADPDRIGELQFWSEILHAFWLDDEIARKDAEEKADA